MPTLWLAPHFYSGVPCVTRGKLCASVRRLPCKGRQAPLGCKARRNQVHHLAVDEQRPSRRSPGQAADHAGWLAHGGRALPHQGPLQPAGDGAHRRVGVPLVPALAARRVRVPRGARARSDQGVVPGCVRPRAGSWGGRRIRRRRWRAARRRGGRREIGQRAWRPPGWLEETVGPAPGRAMSPEVSLLSLGASLRPEPDLCSPCGVDRLVVELVPPEPA
jgi:hypothetical protein